MDDASAWTDEARPSSAEATSADGQPPNLNTASFDDMCLSHGVCLQDAVSCSTAAVDMLKEIVTMPRTKHSVCVRQQPAGVLSGCMLLSWYIYCSEK